jgi:hypothetical protein
MAKTSATPAARGNSQYVLEVTFTVDLISDDLAQSEQAIRNETRSWLESLGAVGNKRYP